MKKIIIASSETTYGVCFAQGDADYHSFPLEEDYNVDPEDSYALSKICGEQTARAVSPNPSSLITWPLTSNSLRDDMALIFTPSGLGTSLNPTSVSQAFNIFFLDVISHGNIDERDFPAYISNPASRKRNAWSYIDARDLGQICDLAIKKDGLGFQVFNATNDTITVNETTKEFLAKNYPKTKVTREMGEYEAPLSNRKIREVLGFKDVHDWRKYVKV